MLIAEHGRRTPRRCRGKVPGHSSPAGGLRGDCRHIRTSGICTVLLVMLSAGCGLSSSTKAMPSDVPAVVTTQPAECGATRLQRGGPPEWTASAGGIGFLRFAVSDEGNAAAFLFADPLRAGKPIGINNKILWVVRDPRNFQPLQLTGELDGPKRETVNHSEPANSHPGEIYPSIVDVPTAGCWRFTLNWNGKVAHLALRYI